MKWKQKLIVLAVPATLALAAGGLVAAHAVTPAPPAPAAAENEANETGAGAEKAEGPETPGGPEVGHQDSATDATVDHQAEGEDK